jgi:hypothetical protein
VTGEKAREKSEREEREGRARGKSEEGRVVRVPREERRGTNAEGGTQMEKRRGTNVDEETQMEKRRWRNADGET